jgi:hypothetical protein
MISWIGQFAVSNAPREAITASREADDIVGCRLFRLRETIEVFALP